MDKYNFDVDELTFDIDELVAQLEKKKGRMIVRIPKLIEQADGVYDFIAVFSDFTLLEAKLIMIPMYTDEGIEAEIHVCGHYL